MRMAFRAASNIGPPMGTVSNNVDFRVETPNCSCHSMIILAAGHHNKMHEFEVDSAGAAWLQLATPVTTAII
jgi:hypothetical protein